MSGTTSDFDSYEKVTSMQSLWDVIKFVLTPLASLKLTVALFFFSILLILVATLAQYDMNMWDVIDYYFHSWWAWMPFKVFFPKSFFPNDPAIPGWLPIPGGASLGTALALNLAAAHLVRFKTQAKGRRLVAGLGVLLLGAFVTALVVLGGHSSDGIQGDPILGWGTLWNLIRIGVAGTALGFVALLITVDRSRKVEMFGLIAGFILFGVIALYMLSMGGDSRMSDPSMRILWQLIQGLVAGIVLLVGAVMVFRRRGGIVVIHLGVGLLMFGEMFVSMYVVEEQMSIKEGETVGFARDTRAVEIAVVDRSPKEHDDVVVVPGALLEEGETVESELLPFDIEVVEYMKNCSIRAPAEGDVNPATAGNGLGSIMDPKRSAGGAEAGGEIDIAGVYARIIPKDDPEAAEIYLLTLHFGEAEVLFTGGISSRPEPIRVGEKFYDVSLRYKRAYKPYEVTLHDVRKEDYLGTSTPRDYSSYITMVDESRNFSRENIRIWMNNPLRYAGETFYQQNYSQTMDGTEVTTLQVVTNTGWMIPYVACMLALVGLLYHFAQVLYRFVERQLRAGNLPLATVVDDATSTEADEDAKVQLSRGKSKRAGKRGKRAGDLQSEDARLSLRSMILPTLVGAIVLTYFGSKLRPKEIVHNGMNIHRFADIPIVYGGRVKPVDTLARNTLRTVSNKQYLYVPKEEGDWKRTKKTSSLIWLLDSITQSDEGRDHRVFRVDNLDVLETLSLKRRKRFLYTTNELVDGIEKFEKESKEARAVAADDPAMLTYQQRKLLETDKRIRAYMKVQNSFLPVPIPPLPTPEQVKSDPEAAKQIRMEIARRLQATPDMNKALMAMQPPLVVPLSTGENSWLPFAAAANNAVMRGYLSGEKTDRRVIKWSEILDAYSRGESQDFNRAVTSYMKDIEANPPEDYDPGKINFERRFNDYQPFYVGMVMYVFAFLLTILSWLFWFQPLRRSALVIVCLTLVLHSLALMARIYISGRPPVTNLYSSAVFIGWAGVAFGIAIEWIFKIGFGNVLSSVMGFTTLIIAHQLAYGGDTFTVLLAVLDTQFWLATHVVCITLGYAATFAAGLLAIQYIFVGMFSRSFSKEMMKDIGRMIYGVLCFAIFLSFIGTVLGGLWADDSWGRFWGWDPKENGALMIVLWNALILHARWGKMVADRGVAVLAVLGNIVTAWSWFGVNELGIGLHSYGFTDGVLPALTAFALVMMGIVALGMLPKDMWLSNQGEA